MNTEEQKENLYQVLLQRNTINQTAIRKFIKRAQKHTNCQQYRFPVLNTIFEDKQTSIFSIYRPEQPKKGVPKILKGGSTSTKKHQRKQQLRIEESSKNPKEHKKTSSNKAILNMKEFIFSNQKHIRKTQYIPMRKKKEQENSKLFVYGKRNITFKIKSPEFVVSFPPMKPKQLNEIIDECKNEDEYSDRYMKVIPLNRLHP